MSELTRYDAARRALAECVKVDEAKDIRDRTAALLAYARQRDDTEMQVWVSEIHQRACIRIGQLSRELDASKGGNNPQATLPAGGQSKSATLAEAGISTTTANRYEQLAGGKTEQGQNAAAAAAETYFARSRDTEEPATMEGLRGAIREALVDTLGEPPARETVIPFRGKADLTATALTDLGSAIRMVVDLPESDMTKIAGRVQRELIGWQLERAMEARQRLDAFVSSLKARSQDAA